MKVFLIKIRASYDSYDNNVKLAEKLAAFFPDRTISGPDEGYAYYDPIPDTLIVTSDEVAALCLAEIPFRIESSKQLDFTTLSKEPIQTVPRETYYNTRVNVHASNSALMIYNEVMLLTDSCTDRLQEHLNMGWRMVAVCVQPDQRRPDYILGRYIPAEKQ